MKYEENMKNKYFHFYFFLCDYYFIIMWMVYYKTMLAQKCIEIYT